MQRRSYGMLRFAVWGCLPVCAVPASDWKRAKAEIPRYLAQFRKDERGAVDTAEGSNHMYLMYTRRELHAVSRPRIHGREHARSFLPGLRKIVGKDWDSFR